jgi:hypothetical protein
VAMTAQAGGRFGIGRVLNNTFSVIGRNVGVWAGLAIIFSAIPMLILQFLILRPLGGAALTDPGAPVDPNLMMANPWVSALSVLIPILLSLLLTAALVRGTIEDLSGKRPSLGDCIGTAVSLLLPTLGVAALFWLAAVLIAIVGVIIMFGLAAASSSPSVSMFVIVWILVAIPIVMLALRWLVAVPALVQERVGVLGSLRRSAALTSGSRWALLGLLIIIGIIMIVIQLVLGMIVLLFGALIGFVLGLIIQSLVSTIGATAVAASYVELRQAKEGASVGDLAQIFA